MKLELILKSNVFLIFLLCCLTACSSTPHYYYDVEPTPLKAGQTRYILETLNVNLSLGHGAIEGDNQFSDESILTQKLYEALISELNQRNILAERKSDNYVVLKVDVNYLRNFNYGGNALNKPNITHSIQVFDLEGKRLAKFGYGNYTTNLGFTSDVKIAAFQWKAEDELKDVKALANIIVSDIAKAGSKK